MAGEKLSLPGRTKEVELNLSRQMRSSELYYLRLEGQGLQAVLKVVQYMYGQMFFLPGYELRVLTRFDADGLRREASIKLLFE